METIEKLHADLIDYLREGKFVEGIEDFYAPDATAQEAAGEPTRGRDLMAKNEREFLANVTAYHGIEVLGTAIDDEGDGTGTVFYECVMRWDEKKRGPVTVQQVVVERWRQGKVASIRFYGNHDPGAAA